ncbi:MAG: hypothetical protein PW788_01365 [Micavibrio sp.]|nr:hypothetical protein [Micavibrio sp.]
MSHLKKDFMKAISKASLALMLTVGAALPIISMSGAASANATVDTTAITQQAATSPAINSSFIKPAEAAKPAATELQFTQVKDVAAVMRQYPFLGDLQAQAKAADEQQGGTNPATFDLATYKDAANGREMVFLHMNSPVVCADEGCPLSVYLRDGNTYRSVLEVNAQDPITITSTKDSLNLHFVGAFGNGPGIDFVYNRAESKFLNPAEISPQQATQNALPPAQTTAPAVKGPPAP